MKITFTPSPEIAEQLTELARITARPIGELINDLLASPLEQMINDRDTGYMGLVVEGIEYESADQAALVAANINSINRQTVLESKDRQFHVNSARAAGNMVHFTETRLVKASDFEPARK